MRSFLLAAALAVVSIPAHAGILCGVEASGGKNVTATRVGDDISGPLTIDASGAQIGLGAGCDYRMGRVAFGIVGRVDWPDVKGSVGDEKIDSEMLWMALGKVGLNLNPGTQVYLVGGFAGTKLNYPGETSVKPDGRVIGAGVEVDLDFHGLALFAEYDRIFWSTARLDDGESAVTLRPDTDIVRAGLRWRFGSVPFKTPSLKD